MLKKILYTYTFATISFFGLQAQEATQPLFATKEIENVMCDDEVKVVPGAYAVNELAKCKRCKEKKIKLTPGVFAGDEADVEFFACSKCE